MCASSRWLKGAEMSRRADDRNAVVVALGRGLMLIVWCVLAACSQAPAPVTYLPTSSTGEVVLAAAPIPQPKPNQPGLVMTDATVDPITLKAIPPVPQHKPPFGAGEVATVVVETQPVASEPEEVFVDEDIVLAPPAEPAGQDVIVEAGDTVYALSRRYGIAVRDIIQANNLAPPYHLLIGQTIRLPAQRTHVVRGGETIYGISRAYGITTSELVRANGLSEPYQLFVGQRLVLPAGEPPAPGQEQQQEVEVAVVVPQPEPAPTAYSILGVPLPKPKPAPPVETVEASVGPVTAADIPARTGGKFSWPVIGPVLSSFGPKDNGLHNDGINIGAPAGTPVMAAEDGVVAYVGDELEGYGNLVLLRHGDGWVTAYAHNAEVRVARGQRVSRGQVIATVGTTGNVTSPQTHFEIRKGEDAVDPLLYLETR